MQIVLIDESIILGSTKRGKPEIAISQQLLATGPFSLIFSGIEALPLPFLIAHFLLYPKLYFW
jgi:hypothetical protein